MAVNSIVHEVDLTSNTNYYLNHPANAGMSDGYWFYYTASAANNTLGAKVKPYRWGTELSTVDASGLFTLEGTIQLVTESLNRERIFHGSGITRAGQGVNVQTSILEDDSFFFYHLGDLRASDDIGYWDYAYLENGTTEWTYFQYHQHAPSVYEDYYGGRQVNTTYAPIDPFDRRFIQIHNISVSSMGVPYSNVLGRVHRPSVGGAHNSHYDVELGSTLTKNYVIAGSVVGSSERFHCFYLAANGSQWDVFSRTYSLPLDVFSAEVNHGTYDLADPTYTPNVSPNGQQYNFPFRASSGYLFGTDVYIPVIYNGAGGTYDLKIWKFASNDSILNSDIVVQDFLTGSIERPDCKLVSDGNRLTALVSNVNNGGVKFYVLTNNVWEDMGSVLTNGTGDIIRIHGYNFNTEDYKFYTLLSGEVTGSGTYSGPGIYSFAEGEAFTGYKHLSYYTSSYGFELKNELEGGYLSYKIQNGSLMYSGSNEPQGIAESERILTYDTTTPVFFDKKEISTGKNETIYAATKLADGRIVFVGNVGEAINVSGDRDLLFAITDDNYEHPEYFLGGGDKDDFFTGVVEDTENKVVWMCGYTKSYLAQKRDINIHAFGRGLIDGDNKLEWVDSKIDSEGNQYFIGNHLNLSSSILAKYDYNFNLLYQYDIYTDLLNDNNNVSYGLTLDSNDDIYIVGKTNSGSIDYNGFVLKFKETGSIVWNKAIVTDSDNYVSSIDVVQKNSTDYLVMSIVSGSSTIINVMDISGSVIEQNLLDDFIVNRVRKSETEGNGTFLLAGRNTQSPSVAKVAKGEVLSDTNMIIWNRTYSSSSFSSEAYDIRNNLQSIGDGGLGSLTGPHYTFCGVNNSDGFVSEFVMDVNAGNYQSTKIWGSNISASVLTSLTNTPYDSSKDKFIYAVGYSGASPEGEGMLEGVITSFNISGSRMWTNTLGHMGDEKLFSVNMDVTSKNIIHAGYSESHTNGRRTLNFRTDISGFGTGNYHLKNTPSLEMWYKSSSLASDVDNGTLNVIATPTDNSQTLNIITGSFTSSLSQYTQELYEGGEIWHMFLAKVNLSDIAAYKNTDEHLQSDATSLNLGEYNNSLFTYYQWGAAGDGLADDGNFFGDALLIMSGSGNIAVVGETSGDFGKHNTGNTGVYDYILTIFNPTTLDYEFYQNGLELDEEIFNMTQLNDGSGSIAFVGRTQTTLGGPIIGGYDIFLAIYNPIADEINYYQTGSGVLDRGVAVYDVGNNELAVIFETAGQFGSGSVSAGGLDVGVMLFNYQTNLWNSASYMVGTSEDEILAQIGNPTYYFTESNRIAIAGKTLGAFATDGSRFGGSDAFLTIFNLDSKTFEKYQVGTPANESPTFVIPVGGDKIMIGGFTDASFSEPNNGFFVSFDATIGIKGKASV